MFADRAQIKDMPAITQVFSEAFAQSVNRYWSVTAPTMALLDIFTFLLEVEPDCFLVAREGQEILGYCVVPGSVRRIWTAALSKGHLVRWALRYFRGDYGRRESILRVIIDKLCFATSRYNYRPGCAQVLSIAVRAGARGRGVGRMLLEKGCEYLRSTGATEVKLEVRPGNEAALALYRRAGFRRIGALRDTQGSWHVMLKTL
ncbi:MAG: GNAT family N-acetyltransferase [Bacillota bacterium]|jgi:ribosomal protein S18 acetylase RimI-like enzyme